MSDSPALADEPEVIVRRFPLNVGGLCEPLLDLDRGRRLLSLNPALAVATSFRAGIGANWRRRLDELLALRARDLAERLGFGGTRRALRTIAKLEPESASIPVLRLLAGLLDDPCEKWLLHLPALNTAVVKILAVPTRRELVTFGLLVELCQDLEDAMCNMVVVTLDEIRTQRLSLTPERARARIDSFEALMAEDDDLWDREERRQLFLPFPLRESPKLRSPPELDGRIRFEPLRDVPTIRAHGERQGNCLARRGGVEGDLVLGPRFLYRVLVSPSGAGDELEATLAVVPQGTGLYVDQLRLGDNHPPPAWLAEAVDRIVREQQGPAGRSTEP